MAVMDLLYWEKPVVSGTVFGTVLVTLVSLCCYSLISVVSHLFLFLLLLVAGVRLYTKVMTMLGKEVPSPDPVEQVANSLATISTENLDQTSACVSTKLNLALTEMRRLFLVENMVDTVKFGLSLWCLTYIGAWFNAMTLIILAWVAAFSIPKAYLMHQEQADKVLGDIMEKVEGIRSKVLSLIPVQSPQKKTE